MAGAWYMRVVLLLSQSREEKPGQRRPGARSLRGRREVTSSSGVTL